jgi:hypothetical protein
MTSAFPVLSVISLQSQVSSTIFWTLSRRKAVMAFLAVGLLSSEISICPK